MYKAVCALFVVPPNRDDMDSSSRSGVSGGVQSLPLAFDCRTDIVSPEKASLVFGLLHLQVIDLRCHGLKSERN